MRKEWKIGVENKKGISLFVFSPDSFECFEEPHLRTKLQ